MPFSAFGPYLPTEGLGAGDDYTRLRRAVDAIVAHVPDGERVLIFVDDAHLLDEASAVLTAQLLSAPTAVLVLTVRSGDPVPDSIAALMKDELERVELDVLDAGSTSEMLMTLLDGPTDAVTGRQLFDATRGNPLVVREVTAGLVAAGTLQRRGELWRLVGPIEVPNRLSELIASRLAGFDGSSKFVLETVAMGEPVGLAVFEAYDAGDAVEQLEHLGLIRVVPDERRRQLRFSHPMYAAAVRDSLPERRRIAVLRGIADHVEELGLRRRDDPRRVAAWRIAAGDDADPTVLIEAATDASTGYDHATAERLARAAVRGGGGVPALNVLGKTLDWLGRYEEAEVVLAEAQEQVDNDIELLGVVFARSDNLARGLGRFAEADAVAAQAQHEITLPGGREVLAARRSVLAMFDRRFDDALELAEPLMAEDNDLAVCLGALPVALVNAPRGQYAKAVWAGRLGVDARTRLGAHLLAPQPAVCASALAWALLGAGDIAGALAAIEPAYAEAARVGNRHGLAYAATRRRARISSPGVGGPRSSTRPKPRCCSATFGTRWSASPSAPLRCVPRPAAITSPRRPRWKTSTPNPA